jgi:hypothetical protein
LIIDDNLILIDGEPVATMTSRAVPLTSLQNPGKAHKPIPMSIILYDSPTGGSGVTVRLQHGDSMSGTFEDVPGAELAVSLADVVPGYNIGWPFLPGTVSRPWVRLVVTAVGTFTSGRIFAALVRDEELPMGKELYIDGGPVWE